MCQSRINLNLKPEYTWQSKSVSFDLSKTIEFVLVNLLALEFFAFYRYYSPGVIHVGSYRLFAASLTLQRSAADVPKKGKKALSFKCRL